MYKIFIDKMSFSHSTNNYWGQIYIYIKNILLYYLLLYCFIFFFIRKREISRSLVILETDVPANVIWKFFINYLEEGQWHVDAFSLSVNPEVSLVAHSVLHVLTQPGVVTLLSEKSFSLCKIKWFNYQKWSDVKNDRKKQFFFLFLQIKLRITSMLSFGMMEFSFFFSIWF